MAGKTYQDKYTRWHDKPVVNGDHSNNGWVYSAYGRHLTKDTMDSEKLIQCFNGCSRDHFPLKIDRTPNDPTPPLSKDEVVGMVSFGYLNYKELEASHWNFCNLEYTPKKLTLKSIWKAYKELKRIKKEVKEQNLEGSKKRNYMWENKRTDAYSLGFWLQPWDQYYVRRYFDQKTTLFQKIAFYANFATTFYKGNKSVRMMLWLQCEDMQHWLLKYIPKDKWVRDYFDSDHPFVKGLEK